MRLQLSENPLVALLRQCYVKPSCHTVRLCRPARPPSYQRTLHNSTARRTQRQDVRAGSSIQQIRILEDDERGGVVGLAQESKSSTQTRFVDRTHPALTIAILGGGISGLTTAFYLSKELPNTRITLYESSHRLGGWLHSVRKVVKGGGEVVFEQGPRTLRSGTPAGLVTLELIKKLGLEDEILITPKDSAAARNRFIYYPDRLVAMPGPHQGILQIVWSMLTEPIFAGLASGVVWEPSRPKRPSSLEDESVGSFLQRRLGTTKVGDNVVSAIMHGIYAGDVNKLSVRSLQPGLWEAEKQAGSIVKSTLQNLRSQSIPMQFRDAILMQDLTGRPKDMARSSEMSSASVYTFKEGIGALSQALVEALKEHKNLEIRTDTEVEKVIYERGGDGVKVFTKGSKESKKYNRVVSAISGRKLSYMTENTKSLSALQSTHAVTVMVVNLFYDDPSILPARGFGYLIPRSIPFAQNPEAALGVVFDSDSSVGQDTASGTKVTVMLGGHWWDDYSPADYPTEDEGVYMAKAIMKRHLNVEAEPLMTYATLRKECIPQYTVGHEDRMKRAHQELMNEFCGKLAVVGSSYTGVGLNDCVRAAKDVAMDIAHHGQRNITGLEQFASPRRWCRTQQDIVQKDEIEGNA